MGGSGRKNISLLSLLNGLKADAHVWFKSGCTCEKGIVVMQLFFRKILVLFRRQAAAAAGC